MYYKYSTNRFYVILYRDNSSSTKTIIVCIKEICDQVYQLLIAITKAKFLIYLVEFSYTINRCKYIQPENIDFLQAW